MATKDIVIIPQYSGSINPTIEFSGSEASTIRLEVLENGSVSFIGSTGTLLTIEDALAGLLFFVGSNALVVSGSSVGIGIDTPLTKLHVSGGAWFNGDVIIDGDLDISGSINQTNVDNLYVKDKIIRLNVSGSDATAVGGGIVLEGTSFSDLSSLTWSGTRWHLSSPLTVTGSIIATTQATATNEVVLAARTITGTGALGGGGNLTSNQTISLNTPGTLSGTSTNSSTTNHTHAITGAVLSRTNDTNVTLTLGGSPSTALLNAASLTLGWTGQLSLSRGGTNANLTAVNGGIVYSTASALAITSAGTSGQILKSAGAASPTWNTPAALTRTNDTNVTLTLGGSHATSLINAASLTLGWTGQLSVGRGGTGLSSLTQGYIPFGKGTSAFGSSANLFWDETNNRLGIGTTTPSYKLDVSGNININGSSAYKYDTYDALKLATKGDTASYTSTIIGRSAGDGVVDGSTIRQTALGYAAGYQNTGTQQTALGYVAGYQNTGAYQTALGYYAGYSNSGIYQTAVGYAAGQSNAGDRVIGIGFEATYGNTAAANDVVAIGYQAGKDNTVANQFIIKQANINAVPLIQGDFSSGYVGIGTTTPSSSLHMDSGTGSLSTGLSFGDGDSGLYEYSDDILSFDLGGTELFRLDGINNKIIPFVPIELGTIEIEEDSGQVTIVNMPVSSSPSSGDIMSYTFALDSEPIMTVYSEADGTGGIQNKRIGIGTIVPSASLHINTDETGGNLLWIQSGSNEILFVSSSGNVGIGTTSPSELLTLQETGTSQDAIIRLIGTNSADSASQVSHIASYYTTGDDAQSATLGFRVRDSNDAFATPTEFMTIRGETGNVGIGTTNPKTTLHVNGTISGSGAVKFDSTIQASNIGADTDNTVVILNSSGYLKTDEIDSRVWGSSLVDGSGTANYNTYWSDANTITSEQYVAVSRGGTNTGTLTANKVMVGNGTSGVLTPTNLHWDNSNNRLGINNTSPSEAVDVTGSVQSTTGFKTGESHIEYDSTSECLNFNFS